MVCIVKGMIHNIRKFAGPIPAQKCWLSYETKIIYKKAQNVRPCWVRRSGAHPKGAKMMSLFIKEIRKSR
jgi:hypothetical protein